MGFAGVVAVGSRFRGTGAIRGALLLVAGAGCVLKPVPAAREAAPDLPAAFVESGAARSPAERDWWRAFADPGLDQVVGTVLASNFSVAEAVARVQQARTRARLADAAILPAVHARAGVTASTCRRTQPSERNSTSWASTSRCPTASASRPGA